MNITVKNYRVLPEVNSMKNVLYTVEVLLEKTINTENKSLIRNYMLELPTESTFIEFEKISGSTIGEWVNTKIEQDSLYINKYFDSFLISEQEKINNEILTLERIIENQKLSITKSELRLKILNQQ